MTKVSLTVRGLKAMQPAAPGSRDMHWDALLPSFGVRVTDKGAASFVVMRRVDGKLLRRNVGRPWAVPIRKGNDLPFALDEVRAEARAALDDMSKGVDPKARREGQERDLEAANQALRREAENTFGAVAERFIAEHVVKLRSSAEVSAAIRREIIPLWQNQAIAEITRTDVTRMLRAVAKDRPYIAHHLLAYTRKLFNWAIATNEFNLELSPCDRVKAVDVIGKRLPRDRVLEDREIVQIWRSTDAASLGLPWGPFIRMLLLTGQRLREVANATWSEFDLPNAVWTIPGKRMKAGVAHAVPLASAVVDLLTALPRGTGDFVFSTTGGDRPIAAFSKIKTRLDGSLSEVEAWRLHDLRRTMRTHLGGLPIPSNVAELCIAHAQPGMHKIYDRWAYADEKRRAFELWANRLLLIVETCQAPTVVRLVSVS